MIRNLTMTLILVLSGALAGCAGSFGHGTVYTSRHPAPEQAREASDRGLTVYGLAYSGEQTPSVSAAPARGRTVYGFEYPRPE